MFENYENAYELDCRELHGWEMEQWDLMMEEDETDQAQEAAYDEWLTLNEEIWGE